MTKVQIAYEVHEAAMKRVEAVVESALLYDPNWSGATIEIKRADYTCVFDCDDEVAGTILLGQVSRAITDQDGVVPQQHPSVRPSWNG